MPALDPPPIAIERSARELLRVWGGRDLPLQLVLDTTWEDPGAWGLLLVDIARHASKAYAEQGHYTEAQAFERILAALEAELAVPTDDAQRIR